MPFALVLRTAIRRGKKKIKEAVSQSQITICQKLHWKSFSGLGGNFWSKYEKEGKHKSGRCSLPSSEQGHEHRFSTLQCFSHQDIFSPGESLSLPLSQKSLIFIPLQKNFKTSGFYLKKNCFSIHPYPFFLRSLKN